MKAIIKYLIATVFVCSVILSFNIGQADAEPYYYNKYNASVATWSQGPWVLQPGQWGLIDTATTYNYTFDPNNGYYIIQPAILGYYNKYANAYAGASMYAGQNVGQTYTTLTRYYSNGSYWVSHTSTRQPATYGKGGLVQANLIAEDGTYPNDGRHTDGFWYTKMGPVNQAPTITVTAPLPNLYFSAVAGNDSITITGTVYDSNVGDVLTVKYNIDGGAEQSLPGTINANGTNQAFADTVIAVGGLTEGAHTLNIWVSDNNSASSAVTARAFNVDKTAPVPNVPGCVANSASQITVTPNASDPLSGGVAAGLHGTPYLYNRDDADIGGWVAGNLVDTLLNANTRYEYKYRARDLVGNESGYSVSSVVYTLALDPLSVEISSFDHQSVTMNVYGDPANGITPEYRLEVKAFGAGPAGAVVAFSDYSNLISGRSIAGLTADTQYEVWVVTRNAGGVDNPSVKDINNFTTAAPFLAGVSYSPGGSPDTTRVSLPALPGGAVRFEYKRGTAIFNPAPLAGSLFGGTELLAPFDVTAAVDDYMGVAAVDAGGGVVQFTQHRMLESEISVLGAVYANPNPVNVTRGLTQQLIISAHYTGGSVVDVTYTAGYVSGDAAVATVDLSGLITAVAEGNTVVTATYGSKNVAVPVNVLAPVAVQVYITPSVTSLTVGGQQQYQATLRYNNGDEVNVTAGVTWSVDKPAQASVNTGLVNALSAGNVVVSADHPSGQSGIISINISAVPVPPVAGGGGVGDDDNEVFEPQIVQPPVTPYVYDDYSSGDSGDDEGDLIVFDNKQPLVYVQENIPYGTVYGRVVARNGDPVSGVLVELHSTPRITYTDATGFYRFEMVEPGPHKLYVRYQGKEFASVGLQVKPGNNKVELTYDKPVSAQVMASGEEINFVLDIGVPPVVPVVNSEKVLADMVKETAVTVAAVGAAGGSSLFLLSVPFRRRKNVYIRDHRGRVIECFDCTARRSVVINLTRALKVSGNVQVTFAPRLAKLLSEKRSNIVLMCAESDIGLYRMTMPLRKLEAVVNGNNWQVRWIEQ